MATFSYNVDMRAQIIANMLSGRPDLTFADVITSLKGTLWRAILIYIIDDNRYHMYTREFATPEEAMRGLLEDTSSHVYLELQNKQVID